MDCHKKLDALKENLRSMERLVIAFSGGVDSTFLLRVACDTLGEGVLAVTARSAAYPEREYQEAVALITQLGASHIAIVSEELDIDGFSNNPVDRCYYCKKELFAKIRSIADEHGISWIADGSNADDLGDYRPGMTALREMEVVSPLKDVGLTKAEIRTLSKELGLPTWDKPSFACLSSRIPYGQEITREKLSMIDQAEQLLLDEGFRQVRVRHHGDLARIEVSPEERVKFLDENLMDRVYRTFQTIGFQYTALDLKGYRTGSMNEPLALSTK
ncbi:MAG: PP-loop protein [Oscillospiraceae bacterium]|nr:PP-loop protein [Oscillospiraceae bacterium]